MTALTTPPLDFLETLAGDAGASSMESLTLHKIPTSHQQGIEISPSGLLLASSLATEDLVLLTEVKRDHYFETEKQAACGVFVPKFSASLVSSVRNVRSTQWLRGNHPLMALKGGCAGDL